MLLCAIKACNFEHNFLWINSLNNFSAPLLGETMVPIGILPFGSARRWHHAYVIKIISGMLVCGRSLYAICFIFWESQRVMCNVTCSSSWVKKDQGMKQKMEVCSQRKVGNEWHASESVKGQSYHASKQQLHCNSGLLENEFTFIIDNITWERMSLNHQRATPGNFLHCQKAITVYGLLWSNQHPIST